MFEQELEIEKRQGGVLPLLLIVGLIVAVVGSAIYFTVQGRKVASEQEATQIVTTMLKNQLQPMVKFHTGQLEPSTDDGPRGPQYRLLQTFGALEIGKDEKGKTPVDLTDKGKTLLDGIAGVQIKKNDDGTELYKVPLATRKLVSVSNIQLVSAGRATVDVVWKWEPNQLGDALDASGDLMKNFNSWERTMLIDKYGADFYHGDPAKIRIALAKGDNGWQIATE